MIVCPNCGKENQDHYKFCLGCGSDLPRNEEAQEAQKTATPPTGIPAVSDTEATVAASQLVPAAVAAAVTPEPEPEPAPEPVVEAAPEPAPAPAPEPEPEPEPERGTAAPSAPEPTAGEDPGEVDCGCGAQIPPGFAFCGACGAAAPGRQPVVQSSPQISEDSARLVLILPDGTEGGHVEVPTSEVAIGRDAGGFFETDPFLSPTHAVFCSDGTEVAVKDADSLNGVFLKIKPNDQVEISSGDIFRMGQELILFEEIDRGSAAPDGTEKMGAPIEGLWGRVALIVGNGRVGNAFPVGGDGIVFGRERGDILFPEDGYVSGLHLKLHSEGGRYFLTDTGSSNGTFVKVNGEAQLTNGSFLLMGQQLFRIDI